MHCTSGCISDLNEPKELKRLQEKMWKVPSKDEREMHGLKKNNILGKLLEKLL